MQKNSETVLMTEEEWNRRKALKMSEAVKQGFKKKQNAGEFTGAFASYGYTKSEGDGVSLLIDPPAAEVVRRIFSMFESGSGKVAIAKALNDEGIPCPSVYKQKAGLNYTNGRRMKETSYWTYATVHRILQNPMYAGDMTQGKNHRKEIRGKAKYTPKTDWVIVSNTHEPIVSRDQWERVQVLLGKRGYTLDFEQNISIFAGFLKCGGCGRAMAKTTRKYKGRKYTTYQCGSHKRYGRAVCTPHTIQEDELREIILRNINENIERVYSNPDIHGRLAEKLLRLRHAENLERNLLADIIDKITVHENKVVEIRYLD